MDKLKQRNWTSTIKDFVFQIASDFTLQLEKKLEDGPISNKELAERLNITASRVSQVFNNPGNFKLTSMVEYARALNMKVSVVAYEDKDPDNEKGPINSEIFNECWKRVGSPRDFFDLQHCVVYPRIRIYQTGYMYETREATNNREERRALVTPQQMAGTTGSVVLRQ